MKLKTMLRGGAVAAVCLAGVGLAVGLPARAAEPAAQRLPAPAVEAPAATGQQVAVFSGGCFWGVQGVFEHVAGVTRAVAGYAGGAAGTAQYETVSTGDTGHAESVQVTFDPARVSYAKLLQIFFSVALDPTEVNRQGPDSGTQYRSEVFATTPGQASVARAYIAQLDQAHVFHAPIATRVDTLPAFYTAEGYHQDYLVHNPDAPYIATNDMPKVADLQHLFPEAWQAAPVLALPHGSAS